MAAPSDTVTVALPADLFASSGLSAVDSVLTRPTSHFPRLLLLDVSKLPALAVVEALHAATGVSAEQTEAMRRSMGRASPGRRLAATPHDSTPIKEQSGTGRGGRGTAGSGRAPGRGRGDRGTAGLIDQLGWSSCFFNFVRVAHVPYAC